jgi:competence protein ComEA
MAMWTPAERRGALIVVSILALGAARDLWLLHAASRAPEAKTRPAPIIAVAPPVIPATAPASARADTNTARVDLNHATVEELDRLPGIGPVLAARIVAQRTERGGFRRPEDLLGVRGIGPRLYDKLRDRIVVIP